jgi:sterol desaturase/sphingolipid hydroxylase (fatty acid hydroxylase superfamily)
MVATFVVLLVARLVVREWSVVDLIVLGVLLAGYPFFEWFAHAVVLHSKPVTIRGRVRYLGVARNHRNHHLDPENPAKSLPDTSRNLAYLAIAVAVPTLVVLPDAGTRLTVGVFAITALLTYESVHYLVHSTYRPQAWALRTLRRRHRLHHYRNERRWYGIASPLADTVLRTAPDPERVPLSPTCRTLGIEVDD